MWPSQNTTEFWVHSYAKRSIHGVKRFHKTRNRQNLCSNVRTGGLKAKATLDTNKLIGFGMYSYKISKYKKYLIIGIFM